MYLQEYFGLIIKVFFMKGKKLLNLRKQNGNIHVGSLIELVISLMNSHFIEVPQGGVSSRAIHN